MMQDLTYSIIEWDFAPVSGSIQRGHRPALVIKDYHNGCLLLAALTSKINKSPQPTHAFIAKSVSGLPKHSLILMEQLFWVQLKGKTPTVVSSIENKKIRHIFERKLDVSLGLDQPKQSKKQIHPMLRRGQILSHDNRKVVIVQNNLGNFYSPTTIIGELENNRLAAIKTVDKAQISTWDTVGSMPYLSQNIRNFIS